MKTLTSKSLKNLYLEFFKEKGHAIIPSSSIIPENDPTVLFTTAGMHPLVPYLLGEKHPMGTRLVNAQKCIRTGDIDEVGDNTHCTFFEMLGNWSLGDYFKEDSIKWSYEFLTSEKYLAIPVDRLAVTVFAGDEDCPKDEESARMWESCGIAKERIFYLPKKYNWWGPAGITGPCGSDTEIFIDTGKEKCSPDCSPACDCGKYIEIWNNVFMKYFKNQDGSFSELKQKNVDTGMGLERTLAILSGKNSVYETDIYVNAIKLLEEISGLSYNNAETQKAFRIVLDHMRTATFMIGDKKGITPSNVDQGYVLRRIIRRSIRYGKALSLKENDLSKIASAFIDHYKEDYPELLENRDKIIKEINDEEARFNVALLQGLKEFEKVATFIKSDTIPGKTAFRLYDTFGFPLEMTVELAQEKNMKVDIDGFHEAFKKHQELSHAGSEQRFKGGLADNSDATTNLHTATHLLNAALKKILSKNINQKGSNITAERLRFDFNFERPLTKEEIAEVETLVNEVINKKIDITMSEMTVDEAKAAGAVGVFESKYGEKVKVYQIGDFSKEICGGPHAKNTTDLGHFKIIKEQSSSAGVRRIKAVLEK